MSELFYLFTLVILFVVGFYAGLEFSRVKHHVTKIDDRPPMSFEDFSYICCGFADEDQKRIALKAYIHALKWAKRWCCVDNKSRTVIKKEADRLQRDV